MKSRVTLLFLFLVAMSCLVSSCKRKEIIDTTTTLLTRKWKLVKSATDDNGSKIIESYEVHPIQTGLTDEIEFKSDSTGAQTVSINGTTTTYPFTWTIDTRDTITRNGVGHDVRKYYLAEVTYVSLALALFTSNGLVVYYYQRG